MLAGENLALCVGRQGHVVGAGEWNLAYCSQRIEDYNLFYRGGNVNFPLYVYPSSDRSDLFAQLEPSDRQPNLNPALLVALTKAHGRVPVPEDIFRYIYAVLYAPSYREKYAESLRREFPRVPFTADRELFNKITSLGVQLTELHLLTSPELDTPICRFEGQGEMTVAKTKAEGFYYDPNSERMYVNKTTYFGPIPPKVYEYRIGGYQVCDKWLKDRKGHQIKDFRIYC